MAGRIPEDVLEIMAGKFRLLGDATRLAILQTLMETGENTVSAIVEQTGRSQANVSKHLQLLTDAGLLARRRTGNHVYYRPNDPMIKKLCRIVCESIQKDFQSLLERQRHLVKRIASPR